MIGGDPSTAATDATQEVTQDHVIAFLGNLMPLTVQAIHNLFASTGEDILAPTRIRFRTKDAVRRSLADAGFRVEDVYGDWGRQPVSDFTPELIWLAVR
jgi:hypothetical protein